MSAPTSGPRGLVGSPRAGRAEIASAQRCRARRAPGSAHSFVVTSGSAHSFEARGGRPCPNPSHTNRTHTQRCSPARTPSRSSAGWDWQSLPCPARASKGCGPPSISTRPSNRTSPWGSPSGRRSWARCAPCSTNGGGDPTTPPTPRGQSTRTAQWPSRRSVATRAPHARVPIRAMPTLVGRGRRSTPRSRTMGRAAALPDSPSPASTSP